MVAHYLRGLETDTAKRTIQDGQKIPEDMISPLPPTLGIGLVYSCYFEPEMGISRVNKFQRYAY